MYLECNPSGGKNGEHVDGAARSSPKKIHARDGAKEPAVRGTAGAPPDIAEHFELPELRQMLVLGCIALLYCSEYTRSNSRNFCNFRNFEFLTGLDAGLANVDGDALTHGVKGAGKEIER